jgi:hypothetical protein
MLDKRARTKRFGSDSILLETLVERPAYRVERLVLDRERFELFRDDPVHFTVYCQQGSCNLTDFETKVDLAPGDVVTCVSRQLYVQESSALCVLVIVTESATI